MQREIATERVQVEVSDGTMMEAYVARPSAGAAHPALLVLPEIFGVNAHIRDIAERFAREGFVALAPDLFHRIAPGYDVGYDKAEASIALAMKYTAEQSELDLRAAYAHLSGLAGVDKGRIAAIGFCMGGRLAFVANGITPLRAAVSFYGNISPDKLHFAPHLSGPMLLVWASRDSYISVEQHRSATDELRRHGKPFVDIEFSDVNHGFFCDARPDHNAAAAAQAWPLTLAFLRAHLA